MCINLFTSTIAYLIGTTTGLILIHNRNKEKRLIGYFILFYTLVQLFEALIYYSNKKIYSRLLLINLGLQGLVFILLLNNYVPVNKVYIYILATISIYLMYKSIQPKFLKATTDNGMKWNFIKYDNYILLSIMYTLSFLLVYLYSNKLNYFNKLGFFLLLTYVISYYVNISCSPSKPSIWCLSSALVAPIMLIV